jgi:uncharacterized damage-inducible protein DinB
MTGQGESQLAADVNRVREDLDAARQELLNAVAPLSDADLQRAKRGHWSVKRVLQHVLESERLYVAGMAHLQGQPAPSQRSDVPDGLDGFVAALTETRNSALSLLQGASDSTFYELRPLGHEEYSVLSLLENVALHDREHAAQIEQIMAET